MTEKTPNVYAAFINKISAAANEQLGEVSADADPKTQQEEDFAAKISQAQLEGMKQDIGERKVYAKRIFVLVCFWVAGMFVLLLLQGLGGWWWLRFSLSQPILLAAVGSTTVNVLGIFYIVAHYLFPNAATHTASTLPAKKEDAQLSDKAGLV